MTKKVKMRKCFEGKFWIKFFGISWRNLRPMPDYLIANLFQPSNVPPLPVAFALVHFALFFIGWMVAFSIGHGSALAFFHWWHGIWMDGVDGGSSPG
jgi:hypothetical protein